MSSTVMLIHAAWQTPDSSGYTVVAPPWPLEDRSVGEPRRAVPEYIIRLPEPEYRPFPL